MYKKLHFTDGYNAVYSYNNNTRFEGPPGVQSIHRVTETFHEADMSLVYTKLLDQAMIDANLYPSINFFLKSVKLKSHFSNPANIPITFWIYDVFYRSNMPPITTFGASNPVTAWASGLTEQQDTVNGAVIPYATPFTSRQFTKYFNVAKVTKVTLGPGCDHVHHFKHSPNRKFNDQQNDAMGTAGFYGNLSHQQFVVILGPIGNVATVTDGVAPAVSYMKTDLNCITFKEYATGCSGSDYKSSYYVNNLSTSASLVRIVTDAPTAAGEVPA